MTPTPDTCRCVSCPECSGTGQVEYRTNSYPEREMESCSTCRGSGISEACAKCVSEEQDKDDCL